MTKTEELLKLCNALDARDGATWIPKLTEAVERLIELVRLQHEALKHHQQLTRPIDKTYGAIGAFEKFERGE